MMARPAADWRGIETTTLTTAAIETARKRMGTTGYPQFS
jgi:hypothetical protein